MEIYSKFFFLCFHSFFQAFALIVSQEHLSKDLIARELVTYRGFPFEEHKVTAPDGAVSVMHRIPHGPNERHDPKRIPVLLFHCLTCVSDVFVKYSRKKSLGFLLVDNGYDVWMANQRANPYSYQNTNYSPKDPKYWDYSFQESGIIDSPLMIDYILHKTGHKKLFFIGHAMGTTVGLMLLSARPEYNDKVFALINLSPVAYMKHTNLVFRILTFLAYADQKSVGSKGSKPFNLLVTLFHFLLKLCSFLRIQKLCAAIALPFVGDGISQIEAKTAAEFFFHFPHQGSARNIAHFYQILKSGEFRMYDFEDKKRNMEMYNQSSPPKFDLKRITAPVALYPGVHDSIASFKDLHLIADQLPNLKVNSQIMNANGCGHFSTINSKRAFEALFPHMFKFMETVQNK